MNERIKQFAEIAASHYTETFVWEYLPKIDKDIFDKFAELIVEECVKVCMSRIGNSDYNTGRMHCATDIREHFKEQPIFVQDDDNHIGVPVYTEAQKALDEMVEINQKLGLYNDD